MGPGSRFLDLGSKSNISVCVEGILREFVRIGVVRHEKRVFVSDMLAEQGDCLVKKSTTAMVSLVLLGTSAQAQQMPDADQLKAKIATIQAKYQPRIDALKAEGDDVTKDLPSKEEAAIGFSIGKMHHVDWYVKIPEFSLRQQTWYVKIPEVSMKEQHWKFELPEPCMKYMPFPWGGGLHVPSTCMRGKDWFVKVPETTMLEQRWVLGIPEVTVKEQHWSLDLPEVKVESSQKRIDAAREKGEKIGERGQQLAMEMGTEIKAATRDYLAQTRESVTVQFDAPINTLKAMIASAPDQAKSDLSIKLAELEKARADALKTIDDQLAVGA